MQHCKLDGMRSAGLPAHEHAGFTLVELSIILVVVGLLAGGIMVGRELIDAAAIRASVRQVEEFNTAVNAFRVKYACLPGDCVNPSSLGFDWQWPVSPSYFGNGDGVIGHSDTGTCAYSDRSPPRCHDVFKEYYGFWRQLNLANMIPYQVEDWLRVGHPENGWSGGRISPPARINSSSFHNFSPGDRPMHPAGWVLHADVRFHATAGGGSARPHSFVLGVYDIQLTGGWYSRFSPWFVFLIDSKIDDGLPFSGNARAFWGADLLGVSGGPAWYQYHFAFAGIGPAGADSPVCVASDTSPRTYNVAYRGTSNAGSCGLGIKAAF